MIKKFFKAVLMGLRNCEVLIAMGKIYLAIGWLPMLVTLILKIFKINVSDVGLFALLFIAGFVGIMIFTFICHCIEAMKYQEKNQCDFHAAWVATSSRGGDDYY